MTSIIEKLNNNIEFSPKNISIFHDNLDNNTTLKLPRKYSISICDKNLLSIYISNSYNKKLSSDNLIVLGKLSKKDVYKLSLKIIITKEPDVGLFKQLSVILKSIYVAESYFVKNIPEFNDCKLYITIKNSTTIFYKNAPLNNLKYWETQIPKQEQPKQEQPKQEQPKKDQDKSIKNDKDKSIKNDKDKSIKDVKKPDKKTLKLTKKYKEGIEDYSMKK